MGSANTVRIAVLSAAIVISGCATHLLPPDWMGSYRNCPVSGQAYYRGIPLASGDEHAQAERFAPTDPSRCMLYVVRSDTPGSKSAHAKVFVYHPGAEPPALPADRTWFGLDPLADPRWSERHVQETSRELRKAEIFGPDVYASWELPAGSYVLDASLEIYQPFARAVVSCAAGRAAFWEVTATSFLSARATLRELDAAEGRALVRDRLRSAGMQPGGPLSPGWIGRQECE